jgi:hypothetical protein
LLRRAREESYAPADIDIAGRRNVRFFRRFRRFHGGHLKVHDYYDHVAASSGHVPIVTFTADSVFDASNPWTGEGATHIDPPLPDVLFLAGRDWSRVRDEYLGAGDTPVVNLIQHLRHTEPSTDLYGFLERRAIRICVGPELGEAVLATGRTRGPVVVIPDGIDTEGIAARHRSEQRSVDLLVVATKDPALGQRLGERLSVEGRRTEIVSTLLPREEFLAAIGRAKVAAFLPNETEGFYLPALEAMALGTLVVCPDCVGNRSFCLDGTTAMRPRYTEDALIDAVERALDLPDTAYATMTRAAMSTARDHDLLRERQRFHDVLDSIDDLWRT